MPDYLTQQDVQDFGPELVDFAQRAAIQATAPHLQQLGQQNAALEQQLAIERRKRLDQEVAAAVPNYEQIDADPRWHRWLLQPDPLTGAVRQEVLNDAIMSGSASRVVAFFRGFLSQHAVDEGRAPQRGRTVSPDINNSNRLLTREQIKRFYELHRTGKLVGPEWERTEQQIIAASAQGRVIGAQDPHGK
jgi:hypothetical protein